MADTREKRKKNPLIKSCIMLAMLLASGFMICKVYDEIEEMNHLNTQIAASKEKELKLQEQKEELAQEKINFSNEEYLLKYARGKYLVTNKDGEQVFRLPETEENQD